MKKINVIGTSGSGKSTFAKKLSKKLNIPYVEMDALFWGKNWSMPNDKVLFERLEKALDQDDWVLDGNYTRTTPIKWKKVDTIIWVDLNIIQTLYQSISRALNRIFTQKELWPNTGNKESFRNLFSSDSIVWWTIKTYKKNRVKYNTIKSNPAYEHIEIVHLQSRKECERYLNQIQK
ncbi:MAG: AAA family ATPase [Candidatus Cloacimonetes bacterium]|nr:AAA family ATPase [Candidatus Cloacimonadota bacterium]